jgi:Ca2+-binding RTX toxin-like protein
LNGEEGEDIVSYALETDDVKVNLGLTTVQFISANAGKDTLSNFEGVIGGLGNDTITGSTANETIVGRAGDDVLNGGAGLDIVSYASEGFGVKVNLGLTTAQFISAHAGRDTLSNFEGVIGGWGNDTIAGEAGDNVLDGGSGDDNITGGAGNDVLNGDSGMDIVSYASETVGVKVYLGLTTAQFISAEAGTDTLSNFEGVIGGSGNDTLSGGVGNNVLDGGAGVDFVSYASETDGVNVNLGLTTAQLISANAGTDTLLNFEGVIGGSGNNTLLGGAGNDSLGHG